MVGGLRAVAPEARQGAAQRVAQGVVALGRADAVAFGEVLDANGDVGHGKLKVLSFQGFDEAVKHGGVFRAFGDVRGDGLNFCKSL